MGFIIFKERITIVFCLHQGQRFRLQYAFLGLVWHFCCFFNLKPLLKPRKIDKRRKILQTNILNCSSLWCLQCLAKTWIYLTPYVCNQQIFDSLQHTLNKTFLKDILMKFVAHTLRFFWYLCVKIGPLFEGQEFLKIIKSKCHRFQILYTVQTPCASNIRQIWTQKVPKEEWRCGLQFSIRLLSKIFFYT